jgi:hypothetical protein
MPLRLLEIIAMNKEFFDKAGEFNGIGAFVMKYANIWYRDMIYYRGDPKTTSDWIFVTNGGGNYEVGRNYCIWETRTWIDRKHFPYKNEIAKELGVNQLYLSCVKGPAKNVFNEMCGNHFSSFLKENGYNIDAKGFLITD